NGCGLYEKCYFFITKKDIKGHAFIAHNAIKKHLQSDWYTYLYNFPAIKAWQCMQNEMHDSLEQAFEEVKNKKSSIIVRVLLDTCDYSDNVTWKFFSDAGFLI